MSKKVYTITAALPYANGPLHIGHLAAAYLPPDIYARYRRLKGDEVVFVCGSDEGGAAITLAAKKMGITPQDLVDKYHVLNKKTLHDMGVSFDIFSRTSSAHHYRTARDFFLRLHEKGALRLQASKQYYDVQEKMFLADRYIQGTCPKCAYTEAYGDQCEKCGSTLSPEELVAPKSTLSDTTPIKKDTEHWYLPLDKHEKWLKQWILEGHKGWKANVYGQCKSWLTQGLQPRAITRDLGWGVPVPLEEGKDKVLYVWFEAPIGYISATQEWAKREGKDWRLFWQDPNVELIHFIGKDNIVFHCLIFPAMLKAHGDYILPTNVPANEFMNLEGKKISTSRGHAIWVKDYLATYPGQEDALRYVLCSTIPETKDSDFTWQGFESKNNSELVGILGNFIHRSLVLIDKYFEGKVPRQGDLHAIDKEVLKKRMELFKGIEASIEGFKFREGLHRWMDLARMGNKYLSDTSPWHSFANDPERTATILHTALQLIGQIALLGEPFLPFTSKKMKDMLGMKKCSWTSAANAILVPAGQVLQKSIPLFRPIKRTVGEN